jgi:hypothetical protein
MASGRNKKHSSHIISRSKMIVSPCPHIVLHNWVKINYVELFLLDVAKVKKLGHMQIGNSTKWIQISETFFYFF